MQSQLLNTPQLIVGLTTSGQASVSSQRTTGFLHCKQGLNIRLEPVWHSPLIYLLHGRSRHSTTRLCSAGTLLSSAASERCAVPVSIVSPRAQE